jgi:hypothetical protein
MMKDYEPRYQADPALSKTGGAITPDQVQSATEVAKEQAAAAGQPDQWQNIFANMFKPSATLGGMRPASFILSGLETLAKPASHIDVGGQLTRNEAAFNSPAEQARKESETEAQNFAHIMSGQNSGVTAEKNLQTMRLEAAMAPLKIEGARLDNLYATRRITYTEYQTRNSQLEAKTREITNQYLPQEKQAGLTRDVAATDASRASAANLRSMTYWRGITEPRQLDKLGQDIESNEVKLAKETDLVGTWNPAVEAPAATVARLGLIDQQNGGAVRNILRSQDWAQNVENSPEYLAAIRGLTPEQLNEFKVGYGAVRRQAGANAAKMTGSALTARGVPLYLDIVSPFLFPRLRGNAGVSVKSPTGAAAKQNSLAAAVARITGKKSN